MQVRMRDGVRLATDVYLPGAGVTPAPAVLIRLPYDKTGRYTFIPPIAEHFAANGFACITQDVRGKYLSEGQRAPFENEAADGYDTVEWIIQQPWSNGLVGTWGDSYYGFTQWALASTGHPAHRAMVPRVTGHRFGDMRPGGGMATNTLLDWVVDAWAIQELIVEGAMDHTVVPAIDAVHPSLLEGRHLHRRFIDIAHDPERFIAALFPAGNPARSLSIPALHTGGWFDNLHFWQLDDWNDALASPAAQHQFLRMTTIDHEDYPWREHGEPLGADFGQSDDALAAHVPQLLAEPIAFFRHYLRHDDAPRWDVPTVQFEHARLGIRAAESWPPVDVDTVALPLRPERIELDPDAVAEPGATVRWVHDPANPVPYLITSEWDQNRGGLPDEQQLHMREDVVVLTSDALTAPLDLVGRITLEAALTAPVATTHVVARLLDVYPDGTATMIAANAAAPIADGSTFPVRLGDTAYRVPTGHRLRLAVSTSAAGQYPVHPGTDENPWTATERQEAEQQLHLDRSRLVIQVERSA